MWRALLACRETIYIEHPFCLTRAPAGLQQHAIPQNPPRSGHELCQG